MISRDKALTLARSTGWLARQPQHVQDDILSRCFVRRYDEREIICHEGEPYEGVFGLVDGKLKIELSTTDGDFRVASVKQAVFWFGQAACARRQNFLSTITATTVSTMLFLPFADFEKLMEKADHCKAFMLLTIDHLEEATRAVAHLQLADTERRVAARLALLAERSGSVSAALVHVTQSDLAEMCSLSRVTIQHILNKLEIRGLIEVGYRRILVHDTGSLLTCPPGSSNRASAG